MLPAVPPRGRARLEPLLSGAGGLAALIAASLAGDAVARLAQTTLPGTVIGLLLVLAALSALGGVPRGVGLAARALIQHMNLFYVPAAVGVTAYAGLLYRDRWAILVAILVSTWAALGAGALAFRAVATRQERRARRRS